jgi:hypothetical protein
MVVWWCSGEGAIKTLSTRDIINPTESLEALPSSLSGHEPCSIVTGGRDTERENRIACTVQKPTSPKRKR